MKTCSVLWQLPVPTSLRERVAELCGMYRNIDLLEPALRNAIEGTDYHVYKGDNHLAILRRAAVITDGITL